MPLPGRTSILLAPRYSVTGETRHLTQVTSCKYYTRYKDTHAALRRIPVLLLEKPVEAYLGLGCRAQSNTQDMFSLEKARAKADGPPSRQTRLLGINDTHSA